mmetsp:Transcript_52481/g.97154  ORF Transcript_52481/g.97154 Transcript_52481/m.97154 type:complete len:303 (-) Transcript_52481:80-988(-)
MGFRCGLLASLVLVYSSEAIENQAQLVRPSSSSSFGASTQHRNLQLEVDSEGEIQRISSVHNSDSVEPATDKDWVYCKHFVKTEQRRYGCGYRACPVECGNCTSDEQCEIGYYCSKSLKKCVDGPDMQCLEPTAHCHGATDICGPEFNEKTWVQHPAHCLTASKRGVRGMFALTLSHDMDAGRISTLGATEAAMQEALRELAGVQYDHRWVAVEFSLSGKNAHVSQQRMTVRFLIPVPGPARNPVRGLEVLAVLTHHSASDVENMVLIHMGQHKLLGQGQMVHVSDFRVLPFPHNSTNVTAG